MSIALANELRDEFIGWQCRLRQLAVRQNGGRPSAGMTPRVSKDAGDADGQESVWRNLRE